MSAYNCVHKMLCSAQKQQQPIYFWSEMAHHYVHFRLSRNWPEKRNQMPFQTPNYFDALRSNERQRRRRGRRCTEKGQKHNTHSTTPKVICTKIRLMFSNLKFHFGSYKNASKSTRHYWQTIWFSFQSWSMWKISFGQPIKKYAKNLQHKFCINHIMSWTLWPLQQRLKNA